ARSVRSAAARRRFTSSCARGCRAERSRREEVARDDHALDLARAFADFADLRVAEVTLDGELARVAVTAVDLQRLVARARRGFARVELGHGGFARERAAVIGEPRRAVREERGGVELGLAVCKHPLDGLEIRDRLSELLAVFGVAHRHFERAEAEAEGHRGDRNAAAVE